MPEWMHNRAEHILAKNPSMPKSEAFAIATQQSHALGKSPKGFGTAEGKATAKKKFDTPKDDKKTANPGNLDSPKMDKKASGFTASYGSNGEFLGRESRSDELARILAGSFGFEKKAMYSAFNKELALILEKDAGFLGKLLGSAPLAPGSFQAAAQHSAADQAKSALRRNVGGALTDATKAGIKAPVNVRKLAPGAQLSI